MTDPTTSSLPALQFDRAVMASTTPVSGVVCAHCNAMMTDSYFTLASKPTCASCKKGLEDAIARTKTSGAFARAIAYGLGAAIAGAIVYYAVIALLDLEIGIVAILIGYMVGYAIRKAAHGGGGRRYQILAAALTYFAVGLAYTPIAIKAARDKPKTVADSSHAAATSKIVPADSAKAPSGTASTDVGPAAFFKAAGLLIFFVFALPVMIVAGSMPSGILSAAIIGFGILKAWQMTAPLSVSFIGPLRVHPTPPSTPPPTEQT